MSGMPRKEDGEPSLQSVFASNGFLISGAILFNVVSVWTTQRGMSLVLSAGDHFLRYWAPWIVAVALSLLLLHFTFRLAAPVRASHAPWIYVTGYLIVAAASIFFNFNAIYSALAADEIEVARLTALRLELEKQVERSHYYFEQQAL